MYRWSGGIERVKLCNESEWCECVYVLVCVATKQMRKGKYGILCSLGSYAGPRYHWSNGTKVSVVSEQLPQDNK